MYNWKMKASVKGTIGRKSVTEQDKRMSPKDMPCETGK